MCRWKSPGGLAAARVWAAGWSAAWLGARGISIRRRTKSSWLSAFVPGGPCRAPRRGEGQGSGSWCLRGCLIGLTQALLPAAWSCSLPGAVAGAGSSGKVIWGLRQGTGLQQPSPAWLLSPTFPGGRIAWNSSAKRWGFPSALRPSPEGLGAGIQSQAWPDPKQGLRASGYRCQPCCLSKQIAARNMGSSTSRAMAPLPPARGLAPVVLAPVFWYFLRQSRHQCGWAEPSSLLLPEAIPAPHQAGDRLMPQPCPQPCPHPQPQPCPCPCPHPLPLHATAPGEAFAGEIYSGFIFWRALAGLNACRSQLAGPQGAVGQPSLRLNKE